VDSVSVTLTRFAYLPWATLGRIDHVNHPWYTLELPWRNNKPFQSCIPEGTYDVRPDQEGRFTGYPELQFVPKRSEIVIHPANFVSDLAGCIAPGKRFESALAATAVWGSKEAYEEMISELGTTFVLTINSIKATV